MSKTVSILLDFISDNIIWIIVSVIIFASIFADCSKQEHELKIREMIVKDSLEHLRN